MTDSTNTTQFEGFEYLDLNTVDPTNSVPQAVYTLKVGGAEMLPHTNGANSKTPGKETTKIVLKFTITDGELAGRRLSQTIWESSFGAVQLRKLADAVGVAQEPGEALASWLNRLVDIAPDFKALVKKDDRGNDVDFRTAAVAS